MKYEIVPFDRKLHKREGFDCGVSELNDYLLLQAGQDIRKHVASLFVVPEPETGRILGYYTLSNDSLSLLDIPEKFKRKLPRYARIPAVLLGRLAIDKTMRGQRLGTVLMADAIIRCLNISLEWAIMTVEAKDDKACLFYSKFGFSPLTDNINHLFVTRNELERFTNQAKKHIFQDESGIEEVKILVSAKILKDWEIVAKAKGVTLQNYLVNLANKDVETFSVERDKTQTNLQ